MVVFTCTEQVGHGYIVHGNNIRFIGIGLYGDRVEFSGLDEDMTLMFDDISAVSVLGRNKLNIYYGDKVYQLKGNKRFNALKYVNIYYHYVNIKDGKPEELFLGLWKST